jgi:hypothetical protein
VAGAATYWTVAKAALEAENVAESAARPATSPPSARRRGDPAGRQSCSTYRPTISSKSARRNGFGKTPSA